MDVRSFDLFPLNTKQPFSIFSNNSLGILAAIFDKNNIIIDNLENGKGDLIFGELDQYKPIFLESYFPCLAYLNKLDRFLYLRNKSVTKKK